MVETNNIVFYQTENTDVVVNIVYKDETFWLSQKAMAALFDVNPQAITKHLSNIYEEQELVKDSTCSILEQVQKEGKRNVKRSVEFYNLDAIIAVGYRVNSKKLRNSVSTKNFQRIFSGNHNPPDKRMGEGIPNLEETRADGEGICLCLGGRSVYKVKA